MRVRISHTFPCVGAGTTSILGTVQVQYIAWRWPCLPLAVYLHIQCPCSCSSSLLPRPLALTDRSPSPTAPHLEFPSVPPAAFGLALNLDSRPSAAVIGWPSSVPSLNPRFREWWVVGNGPCPADRRQGPRGDELCSPERDQTRRHERKDPDDTSLLTSPLFPHPPPILFF